MIAPAQTQITTTMSVPDAARALGVSSVTLRRWIRDGAPCVSLGSVGRGCGSTVDVAAVRAWRIRGMGGAATQASLLPKIVEALGDVLRRDDGTGKPAHLRLGIPPEAASELLYQAYRRIAHVIEPGKELE